MKVIHVVRKSCAMLSPAHAKCVYPHTMPQGKTLQAPQLGTRVDRTTLSSHIQELTGQLEVLEMDVCNLNYKLNTFMGLISQQPAQQTQQTSAALNFLTGTAVSSAASMWLLLQHLVRP